MRGLWHGGLHILALSWLLLAPSSMRAADGLGSAPALSDSSAISPLQRFVPLTAAYEPQSSPDFFHRGIDPGALTLRTERPLLDGGRLRADSTLIFASADERSVDQSRDGRHQAVRLGLSGTEGPLRYGVRYRTGGTDAPVDRNQEAREIFMGWRGQGASVEGSVVQRTTVGQDHSSSRLSMLEKRLAVDMTAPSWPTFSLAYSQTDTTNGTMAIGPTGLSQRIDTVETGLTYRMTQITLHAASQYAAADELLKPVGSQRLKHVLSSSYSPFAPLTLTASARLTDERDRESGQHTETPAAEMTVAYRLPNDYSLNLLGGYSRTQNSLGTIDSSTLSTKGQVSWHADRLGLSSAKVSLETGYSTTTDLTRAARSSDNVSAILQLTLTGRSWADVLAPAMPRLPFSDADSR